MCQILGADDCAAKRAVKTVDWTRRSLEGVKKAWVMSLPEAGVARKLGRVAKLGLEQARNNAELIGLRCDRGGSIVRKIGLSERYAGAIRALDEHWDGSGYPERLQREAIPKLARILGAAQHLDVFAGEQGRGRALDTLAERSGTWFDPELVRVARSLDRAGTLWVGCGDREESARVLEMEPGTVHRVDAARVDRVCEAFADVVDAKSPFTYHHSVGDGGGGGDCAADGSQAGAAAAGVSGGAAA